MYRRSHTGIERSTFVVGPDGKIEHVFRRVRPAEHDKLVLGALAA
jgi:peroxiredoxin Q/BCP